MKKSELVERICSKVKKVDCFIERVYGVSHGVGYDLNVDVEYINDKKERIQAHAVHSCWAGLGHLRPNNPDYKYTGSCDVYKKDVCDYWDSENGLEEYLMRLSKSELVEKESRL